MTKETLNTYRVGSTTDVKKLSGFIVVKLKEEESGFVLTAIGPDALSVAMKAVALCKRHNNTEDKKISVEPFFGVEVFKYKERGTNDGISKTIKKEELVSISFADIEDEVEDNSKVVLNLLVKQSETEVNKDKKSSTHKANHNGKIRENPRNNRGKTTRSQ